jgi:hypothetical protein
MLFAVVRRLVNVKIRGSPAYARLDAGFLAEVARFLERLFVVVERAVNIVASPRGATAAKFLLNMGRLRLRFGLGYAFRLDLAVRSSPAGSGAASGAGTGGF